LPIEEVLGLVAGLVISISLIPQIVRVIKLKSAHEVSLLFTSMLLFGTFLWLIYGIVLHLLPLIIWNSIGIVLDSLLLYAKLKYGKD
jgi:MtN3 and saliva related transmembrane protein